MYDLQMVADDDTNFDVGVVNFQERASVAIIGLRWVDNDEATSQLVVALPAEAFPRRIADRPLPPTFGLSRLREHRAPLSFGDNRELASDVMIKVKLGLLPQASLRWVRKYGGEAAAYPFGGPDAEGVPWGPGLLELAGAETDAGASSGFFSAAGEGAGRGAGGGRGPGAGAGRGGGSAGALGLVSGGCVRGRPSSRAAAWRAA